MKQTTISDYIQKNIKQARENPIIPLQKIDNTQHQEDAIIKTYMQKNLSQVIKEQVEFQKIKEFLGNTWYKKENSFGLTDKSNIMIFSTIRDFNYNFFSLYNFKDFELIEGINLKAEDQKEKKKIYFKIQGIEYNSYYLFKASQILGEKIKIFQHHKLKLLFLRNYKYATLICPKF